MCLRFCACTMSAVPVRPCMRVCVCASSPSQYRLYRCARAYARACVCMYPAEPRFAAHCPIRVVSSPDCFPRSVTPVVAEPDTAPIIWGLLLCKYKNRWLCGYYQRWSLILLAMCRTDYLCMSLNYTHICNFVFI